MLNNIKSLFSKEKKVNNRISMGTFDDPAFRDFFKLGNTPDEFAEATYFTCIKILSESVGKVPIAAYQTTDAGSQKADDLYVMRSLKTRPNPHMTPSVFWSTVEANRLHHGNAYVWIQRNTSAVPRVENLWIMPSENVQVYIDTGGIFGSERGIYYTYSDAHTGEQYTFHHDEVMHFKTSHSLDGIMGIPIRTKLAAMLEGATAGQDFMSTLNQNGLSARAVLQYTGDLDEPTKRRLVDGLQKFASGANNAGGVIPIPIGMTLTPLNIKLTDAQFKELRQFTSLQIAAAFGVKPNQLNDYGNSNYSNSEMQQLSFYNDALLYILKQYQEEMMYKLLSSRQMENGYYLKHDVSVIMRLDAKTQADILSSYVNNAIMTPNDAREVLDLPLEEDGNQLIANGNFIPLSRVGEQYGTHFSRE